MKKHRPWGYYEVLKRGSLPAGPNYWVKILHVKPNQSISLQRHKYRKEVWERLDGTGEVTIGKTVYRWSSQDPVRIGRRVKHKVRCVSVRPLIILELAFGKVLREGDCVRIEDEYGRGLTRKKGGRTSAS